MNKYGYTLTKKPQEGKADHRYHQAELMLMTTFQLREICRKERIIQGAINPMDKEELVRLILRYRGADEFFLIQKKDEAGMQAVEQMFQKLQVQEHPGHKLFCSSKITVYEGLSTDFYDGLTLSYEKSLAGTNALVVGGDGALCGIFNVVPMGGKTDCLYLIKPRSLPCKEAKVKNYSLYCMERRESEMVYRIYSGKDGYVPQHMAFYRIPLLDFEIKQPISLSMPMAIDFGTSNTTAGVFLDGQYFEKRGLSDGEQGLKINAVNYARFYDAASDWKETTLFPSVVGIRNLESGEPEFSFGYEAVGLADSSYIDEGFCVFYDIKRWIGDYEKQEEITDRGGRRKFVSRKEILKAYFEHMIQMVCDQFKCKAGKVHISCPVKQKEQFGKLFMEILPEHGMGQADMLDEGACVLYHAISDMLERGMAKDGQEYRALMIDCGGGTTDLCSCRFKLWDKRAAYRIEIDMAYENGDTDFGGNNLTYRIMQFLKIAMVNRLYQADILPENRILESFNQDIFRYVDQYGADKAYSVLEEEYRKAEAYLPTRFREFESRSRADYYKVKNNFYVLFHLAETVKKVFYTHMGILQIALSSREIKENALSWIPVDKWKLSGYASQELKVIKEFPVLLISIYELELLLKADIYGIIRRFMEPMDEENRLEGYSMIKLSGQSCKIDLFRDALKEFVPGKLIRFKRRGKDRANDFDLKMACVDGALRYLKDKTYGFADVVIRTEDPVLPYRITAFTHSGEEVVLVHRRQRNASSGMISRNMEELTLKLYLKDLDGKERYQYTCHTSPEEFEEKVYGEIREVYGEHIRQPDTDDIAEREVKFFVWAEPKAWAFVVVPVYRKERRLYVGKEKRFRFEHEGWVRNFFDGTK